MDFSICLLPVLVYISHLLGKIVNDIHAIKVKLCGEDIEESSQTKTNSRSKKRLK